MKFAIILIIKKNEIFMKDKRIIKGLYLSDTKKWAELENKINKEKVIKL